MLADGPWDLLAGMRGEPVVHSSCGIDELGQLLAHHSTEDRQQRVRHLVIGNEVATTRRGGVAHAFDPRYYIRSEATHEGAACRVAILMRVERPEEPEVADGRAGAERVRDHREVVI